MRASWQTEDEYRTAKLGVDLLTENSTFRFGELPISVYMGEGKPINRKNDIMYENVFDNYIAVLKMIADEFRKKEKISKVRVGLFKLKHNCIPVLIMHGQYPFLKYNEKGDSITNQNILDILDQFDDFRLSGSINISTPKILTITSYADWELIE